MSKKRLKSLRALAFLAQSGRCYYCNLPMWLSSPAELGLKAGNSRSIQCTAEHLLARQDGGQDTPENVVAAHARCNRGRHNRRGTPPSPDTFRTLVMRRVARGKWWPETLTFWHHRTVR